MALYIKMKIEEKPIKIRKFLKQYYIGIKAHPYLLLGGQTYTDKECTKKHCNLHYRSFDDLLDLTSTYYPSTTPERMVHYLLTTNFVLPDGKKAYPHIGVCSTMKRIRFIPYKDATYPEEAINRKMENSKYTWKELFAMVGITNKEEFLEYIKNNREP
jgi:hypothetical protein